MSSTVINSGISVLYLQIASLNPFTVQLVGGSGSGGGSTGPTGPSGIDGYSTNTGATGFTGPQGPALWSIVNSTGNPVILGPTSFILESNQNIASGSYAINIAGLFIQCSLPAVNIANSDAVYVGGWNYWGELSAPNVITFYNVNLEQVGVPQTYTTGDLLQEIYDGVNVTFVLVNNIINSVYYSATTPLIGNQEFLYIGFQPGDPAQLNTYTFTDVNIYPSGICGSTGSTGCTGFTGYTGSTGYTGPAGVNGFSTNTGVTGSTGYTGPIGYTGETGYTGYTGPQGVNGIGGGLILYMNYAENTDPTSVVLTSSELTSVIGSTMNDLTNIIYNPNGGSASTPPDPPGINTSLLSLSPNLSLAQETVTFTTGTSSTLEVPIVQFSVYVTSLNLKTNTIPPGIMDMNLYAKADSKNDENKVGVRFYLLGRQTGVNSYVNLIPGGSDLVYLPNSSTSEVIQLSMYISEVISLDTYDMLQVVVVSKNLNSTSYSGEIYFQSSNTYSHIHSTFSISGEIGPTGYTGCTGPQGSFTPTGVSFGNYVFWDGLQWTVGGLNSVAIGNNSGSIRQNFNAVALGINSGYINQGQYSVAIGNNAGYTGQNVNALALGNNSGYTSQSTGAIAIGYNSGYSTQGNYGISIRYGSNSSASVAQGDYGIAIGYNTNNTNLSTNEIVIGQSATGFGSNTAVISSTSGLYCGRYLPTVSGSVITPQSSASGYYMSLTNGFIIQWKDLGSGTLANGSQTQRIWTFPINFPNACIYKNVNVTSSGGHVYGIIVNSFESGSTVNFTFMNVGGLSYSWTNSLAIAIGY